MLALPDLDPLMVATASGLIALVFARAAYHKAANFLEFTGTLADYRIVPEALIATVTSALIVIEVFVAGGILWSGLRPVAAMTGAAVLVTYALAMMVPMSQGRTEISCGCGGAAEQISPALLWRNAALAGIALVAALPILDRPLGWFDYLAIPLGVATAWLILEAVEQTLQTASYIRALKSQTANNKEV